MVHQNINIWASITFILLLLIFSYFDIRYKKIPNKLFLVSFLSTLFILSLKPIEIFYIVVLNLLLTFIILFLIWKSKILYGGDIKILLLLVIFYPLVFKNNLSIFYSLELLIQLFVFCFFSLFVYLLIVTVKNRRYLKFVRDEFFTNIRRYVFFSIIFMIGFGWIVREILNFSSIEYSNTLIFTLILLATIFPLSKIMNKENLIKGLFFISFIIFIVRLFFFFNTILSLEFLIFEIIFPVVVVVIVFSFLLLSANAFVRYKKIEALSPGDILASSIVIDPQKHVFIVKNVKTYNLSLWGLFLQVFEKKNNSEEKIVLPAGSLLTEKDIAILRKCKKFNVNEIPVEASFPFTPFVLFFTIFMVTIHLFD